LADTLGEMGLWYSVAGTAFVGGSLVDHGGHTPFEPASFGCDILHGPHFSNFDEAYGQLLRQGASTQVQTPQELANAILRPASERAARSKAAQALLQDKNATETLESLVNQIVKLCQMGQ
jgi:3-deoxy-D-manno-octulosonic-acid transferase